MSDLEKKAEELYQKLLTPKTSIDYSDPTILIVEVLRQTREEALEEAAKMLEEALSPWDGDFNRIYVVKDKIRILASGSEKGK